MIFPFTLGATVSQTHRFPTSPSNTTSIDFDFDAYCTTSPLWLTTDFFLDCPAAYSKFREGDVDRYKAKRFEFRQRGTPNTTRLSVRLVPRRYTVDICTIALTLIETIPVSLLPAPVPVPPAGGWPKQDVSNYFALDSDVDKVILACPFGTQAGWIESGDHGGLGLFVFGTGSYVDQAIPDWVLSVAVKNQTSSATLPISFPVSTSPSNTTSNKLTTPGFFHEQCTSSRAWRMPSFSRDCHQALENFLNIDVIHYGSTPFDFYDLGAPSMVTRSSRATPFRYVFDKCTIAVAMVESFQQDLLPTPVPKPPPGGWPRTDIANYIDLYAGLELVLRGCAESPTPAGWVRAGTFGAIGLFMFATGSVVDTSMPRLPSTDEQVNSTSSGKSFLSKVGVGSSATA